MIEAFDAFEAQELPTAADEDWKYVDIDFDLSGLAVVAEPGNPIAPGPFTAAAITAAAGTVAIVDGQVTDVSADVDGLTVRRIADVGEMENAAAVDRGKFTAAQAASRADGERTR